MSDELDYQTIPNSYTGLIQHMTVQDYMDHLKEIFSSPKHNLVPYVRSKSDNLTGTFVNFYLEFFPILDDEQRSFVYAVVHSEMGITPMGLKIHTSDNGVNYIVFSFMKSSFQPPRT